MVLVDIIFGDTPQPKVRNKYRINSGCRKRRVVTAFNNDRL